MNKNSKIFIAGHRGFVGSKIYDKFQDEGYRNIVVRTSAELDLTNQTKTKHFFEKENPEYVILAAAKVGGIMANIASQADFLYENLAIQNNVIWSSHVNNVKKLLFLGSSCIYPRGCPQPMKEEYFMTGKLEPTNEGYAVAKIAGMELCEKIRKQYNKNFISIMPCNVYGPGDNFDPRTSHVIASLIRRFVEARKKGLSSVEVWGTGRPKREFLYVDDLADAVYFLMKTYNEPQFINVGTGHDISIRELAKLIKKMVGFKGRVIFNRAKPDGMMKKLLDVSRLKALGWKPKTSLKVGLEKSIEWYQDHLVSQNS